jgi:pyruvate dehydrogenase E1 component alpha subunit
MEYTPIADVIPVALPAADRAAAYGLDRIVVDGNDVAAVRDVAGAAVAAAREGRGPSLVEAQTYRLKGHSAADAAAYRPAEEVARWRERDPLLLTRTALVKAGTAESVLEEIDARTKSDLAELARQVLDRPGPEPAAAWTDVWSDGSGQWRN